MHDSDIGLLGEDQDNIINVVPPFPAGDIETWEEFDKMFKEYKKKNKLKFRVRSSQSTELHNRNENHTHSHPTTDSVASSYLTTKTLPLDDQDREDVKTLADARVSSKHIANFLNERIGCK
ncbi:hypothetical protein PHYPSEUDO_004215, partial [Phytophthora pseudosyringae]